MSCLKQRSYLSSSKKRKFQKEKKNAEKKNIKLTAFFNGHLKLGENSGTMDDKKSMDYPNDVEMREMDSQDINENIVDSEFKRSENQGDEVYNSSLDYPSDRGHYPIDIADPDLKRNSEQFLQVYRLKPDFSSCGQNRIFSGIKFCPYSTESSMNVFDRMAKRKHRDIAATASNVKDYDYLREEVGNRVADRVYDITRKFAVAVELGCGRGHVSKHLCSENVEFYYHCDVSAKSLEQCETPDDAIPNCKVLVDEELLPFSQNSVDIFLSSLNFHWINDLPGVFQQILYALKPDGVLIASLFGGDTLFELRCSLQLAELEREGGFAPHISPFTEARDLGDLLNRAGYSMLTIDTDEITVNYPSIFELMWDLKGMAENNASWNRKAHLHQDTLLAAAAIYKELYGNEDGTIPATFQILYLIGWKPHESQAKPASRGSGTVSMKDLSKLGKDT